MHPTNTDQIAAVVLLDIAVIVIVARCFGLVARRLGQPTVTAEIIAGLALGPSLLGALPGDPTEFLFPAVVHPYLKVIASLGLIIFMFIVGLELDLGLLAGKARVAMGISISSVILPFALGAGLAVWLYGSNAVAEGHPVDRLPFILFIGAAMSVTAFPVLARILSERGMHRTETGSLALASAAVDDVLAWTMLAVVVAVVNASSAMGLVVMLAESIAFVSLMFLVVRPRLRALVSWRREAGRLTPDIFAIVLVGVLVSSFITSQIGIHSIFGAFIFGAMMPRRDAAELSADILERIEQVTVLLLLPVFFITTGLDVNVDALGSRGALELGAILVVACAGKFLGATFGARMFGVPARRAPAVGVLMNTRGLTELVILNIGYEAHVLDRNLYTALVLMAVITTLMTSPLLKLVYTDRMVARDVAQAERAALGLSADYRVVAAVAERDGEYVVDAGLALLGGEVSSELVISRFDPPYKTLEVGTGLTSELAAVAASFESLQALSRRAVDRGVTTVVRSQFSDHVAHDLDAQLLAAAADTVVVGDSQVFEALVAHTECAVVLLLETLGSEDERPDLLERLAGVVVVPGTGDDGLAAVEQACRIACAGRVNLALLDRGDRRERRRLQSMRGRLSATGLPFVLAPDVANGARPTDIAVVGWSDWEAMSTIDRAAFGPFLAVLLVRAALDDRGERLDAFLKDQRETLSGDPAQPR